MRTTALQVLGQNHEARQGKWNAAMQIRLTLDWSLKHFDLEEADKIVKDVGTIPSIVKPSKSRWFSTIRLSK